MDRHGFGTIAVDGVNLTTVQAVTVEMGLDHTSRVLLALSSSYVGISLEEAEVRSRIASLEEMPFTEPERKKGAA